MKVYLLTKECGDYHTQPVTIKVYGTRAKADEILAKLKRWYDREPICRPDDDEWWERREAWAKRCPIKDGDNGYSGFGAWAITEMRVVC